MTLKAFLSASGEFWMMRVTDVAGRVSWRCLGCCYLSPFFSSRLFPRGHLYAVWSHLPPTLIAQKEKQGEIWRSKEKYFDIWKSRRRKGWKCCEIHIYWASNYDWVWKGFLRQEELGKLRKYTVIQIGPTLWQKKPNSASVAGNPNTVTIWAPICTHAFLKRLSEKMSKNSDHPLFSYGICLTNDFAHKTSNVFHVLWPDWETCGDVELENCQLEAEAIWGMSGRSITTLWLASPLP